MFSRYVFQVCFRKLSRLSAIILSCLFQACSMLKMVPVGFSFNAIDLALVQGAEGALDKATGLQFPM